MHVSEAKFWQQVKANLEGQKVHLTRIESTTGAGIPDANACCRGVEVWLELKVSHGDWVFVQNTQRVWISRRIGCGGKNVYIMVRDKDSVILAEADHVLRLPSKPVNGKKYFAVNMADILMVAAMVEKKPVRWSRVAEILFGNPTASC